MSEYTKNLSLFKYNTVEDADELFSINKALNDNWDKIDDFASSGGGSVRTPYSLFDVVQKDHVLTFDEKEGLELLGEYVYKEAQSGRYGYPDFYNKCIQEYNEGEDTLVSYNDNITITGNPTIVNGVLTKCDTSNYICPSRISTFWQNTQSFQYLAHTANNWTVMFKIKTNGDITTAQAMMGGNSGTYTLDIQVNNGHFYVSFSSVGNKYDIFQGHGTYDVQPFTEYYVKTEFTGTQYKLSYSLDGTEFIEDIVCDSSLKLESTTDISYIGIRGNLGCPFLGEIDLKESYIMFDDMKHWVGSESYHLMCNNNGHKYYISTNTLTKDGILDAGYGDKDYGKVSLPINLGKKNFKFSGKFKLKANSGDDSGNIMSCLENCHFSVHIVGKNLGFNFAEGTSWNNGTVNHNGTTSIEKDTWYYFYLERVGSVVSLYTSMDKQEWTFETSFEKDLDTGSITGFMLGNYPATSGVPGQTILDLNEFSFELDGETLWTGVTKTITHGGKDYIDKIYNETGVAWYYGVDLVNQKILLPRRTNRYIMKRKKPTTNDLSWYNLYSDGWLEQGGIPPSPTSNWTDKTVNLLIPYNSIDYIFKVNGNWSDAGSSSCTIKSKTLYNVTFTIASNTAAQYGWWEATGYIEPPVKQKHSYMVVGNTPVITPAKTNIMEVATSKNDTIPLGTGIYSAKVLEPNIGWVISDGTFLSGEMYKGFYTKAVAKIGQEFHLGLIKNHTEDYNDFDLVINQDEETFRLPRLIGSEDKLGDKVEELTLETSDTKVIAPADGWYYVNKVSGTTALVYLSLINDTKNCATNTYCYNNATMNLRVLIPCCKGDVVRSIFSTTGATNNFRFIYAKGNGDLYFKVGNAVENIDLINVAELTTEVHKKLDKSEPQYFYDNKDSAVIFTDTTIGTHIVDITPLIPDDGHSYDLHVDVTTRLNDTSANNRNLDVYDETSTKQLFRLIRDGQSTGGKDSDITMVGTIQLASYMRKLAFKVSGTSDNTFVSITFRVNGYRRY